MGARTTESNERGSEGSEQGVCLDLYGTVRACSSSLYYICRLTQHAPNSLVSIARGEQEYFDPSGIPTATESCKSNALMRCCKDLGIASELWCVYCHFANE